MGKRWSLEEDKKLLDEYSKGTKHLLEIFPGRTKNSLYQRKFALAHAPITFDPGNALPESKEAPQPWPKDR